MKTANFPPVMLGTVKVLRATFTHPTTGVPVDPQAVTLTVVAPDGTTTTPTPENPSEGVFEHRQDLDQVGVWKWLFKGRDTTPKLAGDVAEGRITVEKF